MIVRLIRKHSQVEKIVKLTHVNVCVKTFIANAYLLTYKRLHKMERKTKVINLKTKKAVDEIKVLSAVFTEVSVAYIPRSMNVRDDSLAKGGRSRVFGSPFVNCFAPSWLVPCADQEAAN